VEHSLAILLFSFELLWTCYRSSTSLSSLGRSSSDGGMKRPASAAAAAAASTNVPRSTATSATPPSPWTGNVPRSVLMDGRKARRAKSASNHSTLASVVNRFGADSLDTFAEMTTPCSRRGVYSSSASVV